MSFDSPIQYPEVIFACDLIGIYVSSIDFRSFEFLIEGVYLSVCLTRAEIFESLKLFPICERALSTVAFLDYFKCELKYYHSIIIFVAK